jgi:hypothetical protein
MCPGYIFIPDDIRLKTYNLSRSKKKLNMIENYENNTKQQLPLFAVDKDTKLQV